MKKFKNTSEIEPYDGIIGQQRAEKAMQFGLKMNNPAYNIYVSGNCGSGRITYTIKAIESQQIDESKIKDWCYVYNFKDPRKPIAIDFPAGEGSEFKTYMEDLIECLTEEINDAFENEEYELTKNKLLQTYEFEKEKLLKNIRDYGKEKGFKLKSSSSSFIFIPIDDNYEDEISAEEFCKTKKELEEMAIQVLYKLKSLEERVKQVVIETENQIGKLVVEPYIEAARKKYSDNKKVIEYLDALEENIIESIYYFYLDEDDLKDKYDKDYALKYEVNLFVSNDNFSKIIVENDPRPSNLFGRVEYEYHNGNLKTDFTKIIPGAFHKANGGYVILYVDQLLRYANTWELLKKTLKTKQIDIEGQGFINPMPIPCDLKIILIGSKYLYNLIYNYDPEFMKYFKVFVDFDDEMDKTEENEDAISRFISYQCNKNNYKHLTYDAVTKVINQSMKMVEDKNKLSTNFNKLMDMIDEGNLYAKMDGSKYIEKRHIDRAILAKKNRIDKIEEKIDESYKNENTLIDIEGKQVGVINGLSVLSTGEHTFGKPSRITVATACGNRGIVNIEREVKMSGSIHNKGVLILEGYLAENFAQEFPLSLNAYICFEQNYGGVDGDSASSAELYALLSSLSNLAIKQNIAVTGSINQKGQIQVVGGIPKKIEGFYYCCKHKGLTGEQGVIIPAKNEDNLVLCEEVEEAIKNKKFHIYKVNKVEEAMEILKNKYNIKIILLTAGSKGSTAYYKDLVVKQEAYLQSNTIDTTGAGDTFCGSCLGYIIENDIDNLNEEKIKDMISFASAAASIVTTKKGAICSMPEIEEVEKLRKKYE